MEKKDVEMRKCIAPKLPFDKFLYFKNLFYYCDLVFSALVLIFSAVVFSVSL